MVIERCPVTLHICGEALLDVFIPTEIVSISFNESNETRDWIPNELCDGMKKVNGAEYSWVENGVIHYYRNIDIFAKKYFPISIP